MDSRLLSLIVVVLVCVCLTDVQGQLSLDYYASSCPNVEDIVRRVVRGSMFADPTARAALCRLAFHDCQVGMCDASILLFDGPDVVPEIQAQSNLGIRKLQLIDRIKAAVEAQCPETVSCADIIALAGRDAVFLSGGPDIDIPLGRLDALSANAAQADQQLPSPKISVDGFLNLFGGMGMSVSESVAILGSHTLGVAHCPNIMNRLYPVTDPNLGFLFANSLRARCPARSNSRAFVNLDFTSLAFDNQYFRTVANGRGVLTIDAELGFDPRTAPVVAQFAGNTNIFFSEFASAFVKLTARTLTGSEGEVRINCRSVN